MTLRCSSSNLSHCLLHSWISTWLQVQCGAQVLESWWLLNQHFNHGEDHFSWLLIRSKFRCRIDRRWQRLFLLFGYLYGRHNGSLIPIDYSTTLRPSELRHVKLNISQAKTQALLNSAGGLLDLATRYPLAGHEQVGVAIVVWIQRGSTWFNLAGIWLADCSGTDWHIDRFRIFVPYFNMEGFWESHDMPWDGVPSMFHLKIRLSKICAG